MKPTVHLLRPFSQWASGPSVQAGLAWIRELAAEEQADRFYTATRRRPARAAELVSGGSVYFCKSGGSSPRGRGTLPGRPETRRDGRFIPAWAGNTRSGPRGPTRKPVHPRVGGEHAAKRAGVSAEAGSSPRGRGTLPILRESQPSRRFIPAWAGNTRAPRAPSAHPPVHPRVGGEHMRSSIRPCASIGSSPRGRGTPRRACAQAIVPRFIPAWAGNTKSRLHKPLIPIGSSPRGRGTPRRACAQAIVPRFIPAWAGNTSLLASRRSAASVHPRVGGEHGLAVADLARATGSSPRGRGTPAPVGDAFGTGRFIPAWAGNTEKPAGVGQRRTVHPRVGGEHRRSRRLFSVWAGSSPRGRGTRLRAPGPTARPRFIPAWAGNTAGGRPAAAAAAVHPRVGGEHLLGDGLADGLDGSSPRGRGTLFSELYEIMANSWQKKIYQAQRV